MNKLVLFVTIFTSTLTTIINADNDFEDTSTGKFQSDCIKWHNYYRKLHGASLLKHSAKLEDFARYRATEIAKQDGSNFRHPDDLDYGENLAWNSIVNVDCRVPLKLWYDEWKIYNYRKPNITARNGHFTQMVWRDTRKIGCGRAVSSGPLGGTYTVCNYDPPGNYIGEELENVKPALKKKHRSQPPTSPKRTVKPRGGGNNNNNNRRPKLPPKLPKTDNL
ncbi:Golgi-associated plant pathogenesis-related protein 1-like [Oppia nitens]|uniref:Golgi-associated plant pathogenesis-related protein 1-like n=1 Tax=Oppia nitens TaxID=1686743 RepID=UPI0023DB62A4|nr:Golgi-associated plant pathogenesis-related protein 1-like [Oppia nitens]